MCESLDYSAPLPPGLVEKSPLPVSEVLGYALQPASNAKHASKCYGTSVRGSGMHSSLSALRLQVRIGQLGSES